MKGLMLLKCPACDAVYMLDGDFINGEGRIVRASSTEAAECYKCSVICEEVGII